MGACVWEHGHICESSGSWEWRMGRMWCWLLRICKESGCNYTTGLGLIKLALQSAGSRYFLFPLPLSFQLSQSILFSQKVSELEVKRGITWQSSLLLHVRVISGTCGSPVKHSAPGPRWEHCTDEASIRNLHSCPQLFSTHTANVTPFLLPWTTLHHRAIGLMVTGICFNH